jgi:hypothetical protein
LVTLALGDVGPMGTLSRPLSRDGCASPLAEAPVPSDALAGPTTPRQPFRRDRNSGQEAAQEAATARKVSRLAKRKGTAATGTVSDRQEDAENASETVPTATGLCRKLTKHDYQGPTDCLANTRSPLHSFCLKSSIEKSSKNPGCVQETDFSPSSRFSSRTPWERAK